MQPFLSPGSTTLHQWSQAAFTLVFPVARQFHHPPAEHSHPTPPDALAWHKSLHKSLLHSLPPESRLLPAPAPCPPRNPGCALWLPNTPTLPLKSSSLTWSFPFCRDSRSIHPHPLFLLILPYQTLFCSSAPIQQVVTRCLFKNPLPYSSCSLIVAHPSIHKA